jgi:hypothetical protein
MKVVKNTRWKEPMAEEIRALLKNNTWGAHNFSYNKESCRL